MLSGCGGAQKDLRGHRDGCGLPWGSSVSQTACGAGGLNFRRGKHGLSVRTVVRPIKTTAITRTKELNGISGLKGNQMKKSRSRIKSGLKITRLKGLSQVHYITYHSVNKISIMLRRLLYYLILKKIIKSNCSYP